MVCLRRSSSKLESEAEAEVKADLLELQELFFSFRLKAVREKRSFPPREAFRFTLTTCRDIDCDVIVNAAPTPR